jgi:putative membrane protein
MPSDEPGAARAADAPGGVARFAAPRRLHPASVVLGINVRSLIQNYLIPAAATVALAGLTLTVVAVVAAVALVVRVLEWQRFTYAFDGETLRVDEGVLSRDHRALDIDRIQQVEIDRSLLQRIAGLATLRVETAGSAGPGAAVELRVIPEPDARALRTALRAHRTREGGVPGERARAGVLDTAVEPSRRLIRRVALRHVVLGAVTGPRLFVFPAVIAGVFQFGGPRTDEWLRRLVDEAVRQGLTERNELVAVTLSAVLTLVAVMIVLSVVTAIAVGVLRDANWQMELVEGDLHVSRGLLSTRNSVLPLRRVQLVQIRRNWVRRLLGFAAVRVNSAGGSADGDRRVVVPLIADHAIDELLREIYPGVAGVPELTSHPRPALRRAVLRWVRGLAAVIAALWIAPLIAPLDWLEALRAPSLGLVVVAVALGIVEYRHLAHGTSGRLVASRQGALSVTTSLAPLVKVQAVDTRANPFQRRLGLATVTAHVAGPGGDVEVLDVGAEDAEALHTLLVEYASGVAIVS